MKRCTRLSVIISFFIILAACSAPRHVLVKKEHFEAADQCLLTQQTALIASRDQEHIAETLSLLRESLELQRRGDIAVREFLRDASTDESAELSCPSLEDQQRFQAPHLGKKIVGSREKVLLTDLGIAHEARIDTGATTSSLDARDVEVFERDGEQWVRFKIMNPDDDEPLELERKRVRITQANTEDPERRPVIEMRITIGEITQVAEFTLSNRSHLEFPVLIGRNVLRDLMLVDVGQHHLADPQPPKSSNGQD